LDEFNFYTISDVDNGFLVSLIFCLSDVRTSLMIWTS